MSMYIHVRTSSLNLRYACTIIDTNMETVSQHDLSPPHGWCVGV